MPRSAPKKCGLFDIDVLADRCDQVHIIATGGLGREPFDEFSIIARHAESRPRFAYQVEGVSVGTNELDLYVRQGVFFFLFFHLVSPVRVEAGCPARWLLLRFSLRILPLLLRNILLLPPPLHHRY